MSRFLTQIMNKSPGGEFIEKAEVKTASLSVQEDLLRQVLERLDSIARDVAAMKAVVMTSKPKGNTAAITTITKSTAKKRASKKAGK